MLWGAVIAGYLILRVRTILHRGLLEGAIEAAARAGESKYAVTTGFCAHCEMPLLPGALFCVNCGASVRAAPKLGRQLNTAGGEMGTETT